MTDNAGLRAVISKAQVIDELENTLPGWVKRQHCMFPNYIHVLKVRALPHCCALFPSARATCCATHKVWSLQEKPGGDYEISSDSLWELRGESLVRHGFAAPLMQSASQTELAKGMCS